MRNKCAMLLVVAMLLFALQPIVVAAEAQLDSVLGVPWGSSFEQVRQIITKSNFSYSKEYIDPVTGSLVRAFKGGMYAGYPAYIHVNFMDDQMWELDVTLWEDDLGGRLNYAFDDLNNLLTQKYGSKARDESYNMPVTSPPKPTFHVPITRYVWSINGDAKKITLGKRMTFTAGQEKILGNVSVTYANIELYDALRNKSRQNI